MKRIYSITILTKFQLLNTIKNFHFIKLVININLNNLLRESNINLTFIKYSRNDILSIISIINISFHKMIKAYIDKILD